MAAEEYRQASRAQWAGVAEGWEHYRERFDTGAPGLARAWMLDAAELAPGAEVLELACGPAGVGMAAAERVRPGGRVVCTDFVPDMVEVATRRVEALGAGDIETRLLDAEAMDLPDACFDAALCRFGYMLMADPAAALAETLRVLRPGGRVALAVWGEPEANPWATSAMRPLMEHFGAPPPDPDAPGVFALAGADRLTGLLSGAGFEDVRTERLESAERFDSPEAWWEFTTRVAGPLAAVMAGMPDDDLARVREAALAGAARYADGDGIAFPSAVRVATGRRPR